MSQRMRVLVTWIIGAGGADAKVNQMNGQLRALQAPTFTASQLAVPAVVTQKVLTQTSGVCGPVVER